VLTAAAQVTADNAPGYVGCVLLVLGAFAFIGWVFGRRE
jgi:hypothetical protein